MFARLERLWSNNEMRARLLLWFWLISLIFLLTGFGVIAWRYFSSR